LDWTEDTGGKEGLLYFVGWNHGGGRELSPCVVVHDRDGLCDLYHRRIPAHMALREAGVDIRRRKDAFEGPVRLSEDFREPIIE
jgi:hypothetical protein